MFIIYANTFHSYTHLILALCSARKPTVWGFITSKYPGKHDIGLPTHICFCIPSISRNVPHVSQNLRKCSAHCSRGPESGSGSRPSNP